MQKRMLITILSIFVISMLITPAFAEDKAYMGVYLKDLSAKDYEKMGIKENYGIMITKTVDEGPAEKAAIQNKDVILEMDGEKIYTIDQLTKMLTFHKPEQKIKLKIFRDGKNKNINLVLGKKQTKGKKTIAYLGVYLEDLTEKLSKKLELTDNFGVYISKIVEDSPVFKAGLEDGDVLLSIDKGKIYTSDQVTKMLKNYTPEQQINVRIFRDKGYMNFDVILGEKEVLDWTSLDALYMKSATPENVFVYKYDDGNSKWIGILPKELNDQLLQSYKVENGVLIEKVIEGTPSEEAGLLAGDVILKMNDTTIKNTKDIHKSVQATEIGEEIKIDLLRGGKNKSINVKVAERKAHQKESKVEVSFDGGDIRVFVDGKEDKIINLSNSLGELEALKSLHDLDIYFSEEDKIELEMELKDLQDELQDIEIDLEIIEGTHGDI
jgi:S1-C subfamily serine protease